MTQIDMILTYIAVNGSITQMEATAELGCTRLSARIWDIRNKLGIAVKETWETSVNRFGKPISYVRYSI